MQKIQLVIEWTPAAGLTPGFLRFAPSANMKDGDILTLLDMARQAVLAARNNPQAPANTPQICTATVELTPMLRQLKGFS